ncbi:MAG: AraC family transcriptional regulator [Hyphomicrobiales bacterium]
MNSMQNRRRLELIRVGTAIAIPGVLRNLGADADSVIGKAGLSPEILADRENVIPFVALARLFDECVKATRCEHFGLLVGQEASASSLGLVGLLVEHSPDVRAALKNLIRYLHLRDGRGVPTLEVTNGTASLGYTIFETSIPGALEIVDWAVAAGFRIMRRLCGSLWQPIEVMLPRPRPQSTKAFDSLFEVPVRFGEERGAIIFSSEWLAHSVPGANPLIRKLLEDRIRELDVESFEAKLRRFVRTLVMTKQCSLVTAAELFGIEPRSLARRLEHEEIEFRKLVDEVRYEVSQHLIADTSLAMTQIAASLGYSEASAFTRAFRRWSGMTPMSWRAKHLTARNGGSRNGSRARAENSSAGIPKIVPHAPWQICHAPS